MFKELFYCPTTRHIRSSISTQHDSHATRKRAVARKPDAASLRNRVVCDCEVNLRNHIVCDCDEGVRVKTEIQQCSIATTEYDSEDEPEIATFDLRTPSSTSSYSTTSPVMFSPTWPVINANEMDFDLDVDEFFSKELNF